MPFNFISRDRNGNVIYSHAAFEGVSFHSIVEKIRKKEELKKFNKKSREFRDLTKIMENM